VVGIDIRENETPIPDLSHDREPVYLADAEPHLPEPFRAAADLRARVVLHALFADSLILGRDFLGLGSLECLLGGLVPSAGRFLLGLGRIALC
jgi:hypothetical protein